jgi:hypothetical protein
MLRRQNAMSLAQNAAKNTCGLMQKLDVLGIPPAAATPRFVKPAQLLEHHARAVKLGDLFPTPAFDLYINHAGKSWARGR